LKSSGPSRHVEVQALLILDRIAGSEAFEISVLLRSDGQFIGRTSLGIVAEEEQVVLSLRWDEPNHRFVASSQRPGAAPTESFVPFAARGAKVSCCVTATPHDA